MSTPDGKFKPIKASTVLVLGLQYRLNVCVYVVRIVHVNLYTYAARMIV